MATAGDSPVATHADSQVVLMTLVQAQGSSKGQQVATVSARSISSEVHG
jgi:hypothetical protein